MMKKEKIRKTLFENLFPYHVSQVKLFYGEEKCRKYVHEAQEWLTSFIWLLAISCFVVGLTVAGLFGLSSRTLSKLFLLSVGLLYMAYTLITQLKDIREMSYGDEYIIKKWMKAAVIMVCVSVVSAAFNIFSIIGMLDFSGFKKEEAKIPQLGIEMTFPRGWSKVEVVQRPRSRDRRPIYRFKVRDDYRVMFFDLYGWIHSPDTEFKDIKQMFDEQARNYMDSTIIAGPEVVETDGVVTYRTIGTRTGSPRHVFIYHQMLHQGSVMTYSYRYEHKHGRYEREVAVSEKMLKNFRFTDVTVPRHAGQPLPMTHYLP